MEEQIQIMDSIKDMKLDKIKAGKQMLRVYINGVPQIFTFRKMHINVLSMKKATNIKIENLKEEIFDKTKHTEFYLYDSYIYFLKIKNEFIPCNCNECKMPEEKEPKSSDFPLQKDAKLVLNQIDLMNNTNDDYFEYKYNLSRLENTANYYYLIKLDENNYFHYNRRNRILSKEKNGWQASDYIYIINPAEKTFYYVQKMDILDVITALQKIDFKSNNYEKFKLMIKIFTYTIADYLKDKSILNEIVDFYSNIPFLTKEYIMQFFEPIYKTEEFVAYIKSPYNKWAYWTTDLYYVFKPNYGVDEWVKSIKINKRISWDLYKCFVGKNLINPKTKEIIKKEKDHEYTIEYETHNCIVINDRINHSVSTFFFYNHNEFFIEANYNEEIEIRNSKEIIDTLCN